MEGEQQRGVEEEEEARYQGWPSLSSSTAVAVAQGEWTEQMEKPTARPTRLQSMSQLQLQEEYRMHPEQLVTETLQKSRDISLKKQRHFALGENVVEQRFLRGLEPIRNVSEKSKFYDSNIPYIAVFSNGTEQMEPINLSIFVNENRDPEELTWLNGDLYCLGPGLFDIEYLSRHNAKLSTLTIDTWFDGLAQLHRFQFTGNALQQQPIQPVDIQYRSRFIADALEDRLRKQAQAHGKDLISNPNKWAISHLNQVKWTPEPTDINANQHLLMSGFPYDRRVHDPRTRIGFEKPEIRLLAMSDLAVVQEIDPITLVPKVAQSLYQVNEKFGGILVSPPVRDEITGEIVQAVMHLGLNTRYVVYSLQDDDFMDPPGHVVCDIKADPSLGFQIALTQHYIILIRFPYRLPGGNWALALSKELVYNAKFNEQNSVFFHVIDRNKRREIACFKTSSFYSLGVLNAYEQANTVYIDLNGYKSDLIRSCLSMANLRSLGMPPLPDSSLRRYALPIVMRDIQTLSSKVLDASFALLTDFPVEFGCISPRDIGSGYQYCYGLSYTPDSRSSMNQIWNTIACVDITSKERIEWKQFGCYPGPPAFIDGGFGKDLIVSIVLDSANDKSFLLLLDALQMTEYARVPLPYAIPLYRSIYFAKTNE